MAKDDDLDLDLDLDLEPEAVKNKSAAADREPQPEAAAAKDEGQTHPAKVMAERKPGVFARAGASVTGRLAGIQWPPWNLRNFIILFVVLLILVVFAENWAPMRLYFFGFHAEMPKAVAFLLDVILGALLMWLWTRRRHTVRED